MPGCLTQPPRRGSATADDVGRDPNGKVDLRAVLRSLHARGRQSVLFEGGPTLAGAFIRAGLVDRVVVYLAPALLGVVRRRTGNQVRSRPRLWSRFWPQFVVLASVRLDPRRYATVCRTR